MKIPRCTISEAENGWIYSHEFLESFCNRAHESNIEITQEQAEIILLILETAGYLETC